MGFITTITKIRCLPYTHGAPDRGSGTIPMMKPMPLEFLVIFTNANAVIVYLLLYF
jgi:hypothetical protein